MKTSTRPRPPSAKAVSRTPAKTGPAKLPGATLPAPLRRALQRVILRQWRVHLGECAGMLFATIPALVLFQALADDAFNLPWAVRVCLLSADVGLVVYLLGAYAVRPWRQRLTLSTAALLVERETRDYHSALISAVELSGAPSGSAALTQRLIDGVNSRLKRDDPAKRVVNTRRCRRLMKWAAASTLTACAAFLVLAPKSHLLLRRVLLSRQALPTRTEVISISGNVSVEVGADLTLSARATGLIPRSGRLLLVYADGEREEIPAHPTTDDAGVFTVTIKNVQQSYGYHFELNDGVGEAFRVNAQVPPAMASCKFTQIYPAYTGRSAIEMSAGNLSLLAGSRLRIEGRATQPLRSAILHDEGTHQPELPLTITGADKKTVRGEFVVPKDGLSGFSMSLTNADGVLSKENTLYAVEFLPDHPPAVEVTAPATERSTIVPAARPTVRFSVRDDFGIKAISLHYELTLPTAPGAEPRPDHGEIPLVSDAGGVSYSGEYLWDLSKLKPGLVAGSTMQFWVEAVDNNDVTGPSVGRSSRKTLVILSEVEKRAELLERLETNAAAMEQLYQDQRKTNDELNSTIRQQVH